MNTVFEAGVSFPRFPRLKGEIVTDVAIIGGGISGILCAYFLKNAGVDYTLLEGKEICSGVTRLTTAKITSLHGFIYGKLIGSIGKNGARLYYEANEEAINDYFELSKSHDCDFDWCDSCIFSFDKNVIEKEFEAIKSLDIDAEMSLTSELPFKASCIRFSSQAIFNPLKLLSSISKDLNIYENSQATRVEGTTVYTEKGLVRAKRVIVATHFPFINRYGLFPIKMYQEKSYALALENKNDICNSYIDDNSTISLRKYKDYLLLGGEGHRTGAEVNGWDKLIKTKEKYFPENKVIGKWATQDCMTLDGIPYIGRYSSLSKNLYVITGFNKWGMTSSMVGAKILADLVQGKENRYASLFSPSRSIFKKQLICNLKEAVKGWLSFGKKRCTHLGCALHWNKNEHIWECSCHGSCFEENGDILQNPANKRLK